MTPDARAEKRALLVACTRYDDPGITRLRGPANDVVLMQDLLIDRFGFLEEHLTILRDGDDPSRLPTRDNICGAVEALIAKVHAGDQIVLFFAGHGSQQPDDPEESDEGGDGLDEIFLPCDVKREWVDEDYTVRNAIVDDELRHWIVALLALDAEVLVMLDSCHSGSGVRGDTVVRKIMPEDLGIPAQLLQQAARRGATDPDAAESPLDALAEKQGRWAAIYAALPTELEPESYLPRDAADGHRKPYGLLTYNLVQLLQQQQSLSYRELVQRIRGRYYADGRYQPTPTVEGTMLEQVVLGADLKQPAYSLSRTASGVLRIDAGQIHGLAAGTILAAFAAGDVGFQKPLGHLTVTEAGLSESYVRPCDFAGVPQNDELPQGSLCLVAAASCGPLQLAVAVDETDHADAAKSLRQQLERIEELENSPVRFVENRDDAQWVFMNVQGEWAMTSLDEAQRDLNAGPPAGGSASQKSRTPLKMSVNDPDRFLQQLRQVQRVQSLLSVAAAADNRTPAERLQVDLQLMLRRPGSTSPEAVAADTVPRLLPGDKVQWTITNRSDHPVDATLLFVDSQCGIDSIFPEGQLADNRLSPGQARSTGSWEIESDTVGREHVVLLAVRAGRDPLNFSFLTQPTLEEATRDFTRRGGGDPLQTPLAALLTEAFYQPGGATRAIRSSLSNEQRVQVLTWETLPPSPARP